MLSGNSYIRNIRLYKYYVIFSGALFIWPIEIVYLQGKGLTFTRIMMIEAMISIFQLIAEIPSGIIADKIGSKKTVMIGLAFEIMGYICIVMMNGVTGGLYMP